MELVVKIFVVLFLGFLSIKYDINGVLRQRKSDREMKIAQEYMEQINLLENKSIALENERGKLLHELKYIKYLPQETTDRTNNFNGDDYYDFLLVEQYWQETYQTLLAQPEVQAHYKAQVAKYISEYRDYK